MRIEDFGEKIGGARKDLWRGRGLTIEDLKNMNALEVLENVNKNSVWGNVNWQELKGTKPDEVLYIIKYIRDKTPSKPRFVYQSGSSGELSVFNKDVAEKYITVISELRDYCNSMNNVDDFLNFFVKFSKKYGYLDENGRYTEKSQYATLFNNRAWVNATQIRNSRLEALISECRVQGFPDSFRGDLKGVRVYKYSNFYTIIKGDKILDYKLRFGDEDEAYNWIKEVYVPKLDKEKETSAVTKKSRMRYTREQLKHIARTGPDLRNGAECTTEDMLDMFKFRGGEFGNWNNDEDRQQCLNYAFDAFVDLACILEIPLSAISL